MPRARPAGAGYHSPLRERRAALTRRRITDSARALFATHGFAGTTITAIAEKAGVAPQTVYATFGSKAAVMQALLSGMEEAADAGHWREVLAGEDDPGRLLDAFARWTASMLGTSRQLIAAARDGSGDPAIRTLAAHGDEHRRSALHGLVTRIADGGALRAGLGTQEAVDRAWVLTGAEVYLAATHGCGWDDRQYAEWLAELLRGQLLQQES